MQRGDYSPIMRTSRVVLGWWYGTDLVYVEREHGSRYQIMRQGACLAYDLAWEDLPYVLEECEIDPPPSGIAETEPLP